MNIQNNSPQKILILLPRQLGDVILATPLVNALHNAYPQARIHWWAHPMAKPILEGHPNLEQRFYYPLWKRPKNPTPWERVKSWGTWAQYVVDSVKLMFKLRHQHYDLVIDAMNYPRSSFQTWFTGAAMRISFITKTFRDRAYTHFIDRSDLDHIYLGHGRLRLLQPLGLTYDFKNLSPDLHPYLPLLSQHKIAPSQWLESQGLKHGDFVEKFLALSPTHRHAVRRWPGPYYVELALRWIQTTGSGVMWFRAPGEDGYILPLHQALQARLQQQGLNEKLSYLPPLFPLNDAAYLVSLAQGWVGNSNGMSHMAVAVRCKTIELHGPSIPQSWCHPDTTKHRFLQRKVGCIQCGRNVCKLMLSGERRECMEDLTVDEVFAEVQDLF